MTNYMKEQISNGLITFLPFIYFKGEALFRLNVTSTNPDGSDWSHVTSDVTFQAITIGGKGTDNSPFKVR